MTKLKSADIKTVRSMNAIGQIGWTADKYLNSLVDTKESTVELYEQQLQYCLQFFGTDKPMETISLFDLESFQKYVLANHKPSTTISIIKTTKRLFTYAYRHNLIEVNPFDRFQMVKDKDKEIKYIPTVAEIKTILNYAFGNASTIESLKKAIVLETILTTANRLQETLLIEWKDIDLDNLTITLTADSTKTTKKVVKVIDESLADKFRILKQYSNCSYVFSTKNRKPMPKQNVQRYLKSILKECNIMTPVTCHSFRRFTVSNYVAKGGNVEYASKQLCNHASIATTERFYLEPDTTNMKEDVRSFLNNKPW